LVVVELALTAGFAATVVLLSASDAGGLVLLSINFSPVKCVFRGKNLDVKSLLRYRFHGTPCMLLDSITSSPLTHIFPGFPPSRSPGKTVQAAPV